jgi:hypothetical protein
LIDAGGRCLEIAEVSFHAVISVVLLIFCGGLATGDIPGVKTRSGGGPEPDHLLPVDPYPGESGNIYRKALYEKLGLDRFHVARMLITPSDQGESVVDLVGDVKSFDFKSSKSFSLVCVKADQSIWESFPQNNDEGIRKPVGTRVSKAEVPNELAVKLFGLWERTILRSRYSKDWAPGEDGTYVEFFIQIGHGMIWNPKDRKSPLLAVELGQSLMAYCEAEPAQRDGKLDEVRTKAELLEKYLDEHPLH